MVASRRTHDECDGIQADVDGFSTTAYRWVIDIVACWKEGLIMRMKLGMPHMQ